MSATASTRSGRRRRRLLVALPVAGLGALAAVVAASGVGGGDGGSGGRGGGAGARGSEVVERRTLVDSATVDGTLGYGSSRPVLDRRGGTLTWLPRSGAVIRPGERIFEVDGEPVILMDGSTPAWRTMAHGDEGADVLQLERNLAALGYDPGTVDDDFTSATTAAVRAWQEDWGMPETGRVALGDVVFLPGARRVSKLTGTLGESGGGGGGNQPAGWDGGALQTAFASDTTTPPATTAPQTTPETTPTAPPTTTTPPGTTQTQPPTSTQPPTRTQPSGRTTPGTTTPGGDGGRGDGRGGDDTGSGGGPTGSGGGDRPSGAGGDQPTGSGGGQPTGSGGGGAPSGSDDGNGGGDGGGGNPGTEVLQTTATRRVVTADVDAADQTLARVGARATVELPGGKRLPGRIVKVGTVATASGDEGGAPGGEGDGDPTVPVTIELRSERGVGRLDQAPVIVELARETRRDVLAVPVTALIARPGGGYAVSVVRGGRTDEVPVQPGLFADGYVELTGGGVRAGDRVAVPR